MLDVLDESVEVHSIFLLILKNPNIYRWFIYYYNIPYPSNSAVSIKHRPLGSLVDSSNTSAATNCPSSIKITSPTCTSFHFTITTWPFLTVFDMRLFTWSSLTCLCYIQYNINYNFWTFTSIWFSFNLPLSNGLHTIITGNNRIVNFSAYDILYKYKSLYLCLIKVRLHVT